MNMIFKYNNKEEIIFIPDGYTFITGDGIVSNTEKAFAQNYKINPNLAIYELAFANSTDIQCPQILFLSLISSAFIKTISEDYSVETTCIAPKQLDEEITAALLLSLPFSLGSEYVTKDWLSNIWQGLSDVFVSQINEAGTTVGDYLNSRLPSLNIMGRVYFHLVENSQGEQPFAFLATYCKEHNGKTLHLPLKNALIEFKGKTDQLLRLLPTVLRAAEKSNFISDLIESGEIFSPIGFSSDEAYTFLCEIPLYNECGILCRIPDWWKKRSRKAGLSVTAGENPPSHVGAKDLINFNAAVVLDGEELSKDDIEKLLLAIGGLAFIKGKWVEADEKHIRETLEAYEKVKELCETRKFTFSEAIRMQLGINNIIELSVNHQINISNGEWLSSVISKMVHPSQINNIVVSDDFCALLRPYQSVGFCWLHYMYKMGFGACLSDDMGLGKTVQVLALLDKLREEDKSASLLIIPASLIENWCRELNRFAPKIKYCVLHKSFGGSDIDFNDDINLYITTYTMAVHNVNLTEYEWETVILDEAQAIKNPSTKQTRIIKTLQCKFKLAMTGTPVENRLSDLWSLFDFLNPGLLGTPKEFASYTKRLQEESNYSKLKQSVSPFILRRLKTDKTIISDLPDKIEMKNYPSLTKKQVVLYKSIIDNLEDKLNNTDGIQRKGIVLASIIKLKQICNHPDLYTGQGVFNACDSGKYELLAELCETISEKRESMLVFTQFREMCEPLDNYLSEIFNKKGLVIHGGTNVKKRGEIVERFNSQEYIPYMVLSLKAGGVGLNLTAANHVVHFDRWWNPAVENQATDRTFRIGQTKNVLVHKFITKGTIEEKIDAMIEKKKMLADNILPDAGENWITDLSTNELMSLFKLEV